MNVLIIQSDLNYAKFYCMGITPSPSHGRRDDSFQLSLGWNTFKDAFSYFFSNLLRLQCSNCLASSFCEQTNHFTKS